MGSEYAKDRIYLIVISGCIYRGRKVEPFQYFLLDLPQSVPVFLVSGQSDTVSLGSTGWIHFDGADPRKVTSPNQWDWMSKFLSK